MTHQVRHWVLTSFLGPFLINSSGAVAFTAKSVMLGKSGSTPAPAVASTQCTWAVLTFGSPLVFAATGFNDSGTVVYLTEARAVYTATAGGTPFMVSASTSTGNSGIFPGINNAGTVAYGGDPSNTSILTRTGTADPQTLVSNTALPGSNALAAPTLTGLSINNSGTVAFYALDVASGASCRCGIYTAGPGAPTPVAPLQENLSSGIVPQINDNGAIAFARNLPGRQRRIRGQQRPDSGGSGPRNSSGFAGGRQQRKFEQQGRGRVLGEVRHLSLRRGHIYGPGQGCG